MEKELQEQLEAIQKEIRKTQASFGRSLLNGIISGAGSILGVAIMLTVITFVIKQSDYFASTRSFLSNVQTQLENFNATLGNFNRANKLNGR